MEEIDHGSFVEEFSLTSYVGDDNMVTSELEVSESLPPTSVEAASYRQLEPTNQSKFLWNNEEEVDFELTYDGSVIEYQVGGEVVNTINVQEAEFEIDSMVLSAKSTDNSQTKLTNLVLNDDSVSTTDLMSEAGKIDFLKISGLDNTFKLSGTQVFASEDVATEEIDLAYQIRVGTFQPTSDVFGSGNFSILSASMDMHAEVPEPKTVSLFSLLLVGFIFKCRRR